ncbi:MAG: pilin [bacterium]
MADAASFINSKILIIAQQIINPLLLVVMGVAILVFVWGIYEYFFKDTSGGERAQGTRHILWGLVGFVIMLCAYGLIQIVLNTFGVSDQFGTTYTTRPSPTFNLTK